LIIVTGNFIEHSERLKEVSTARKPHHDRSP
jgi:hypothetical protein